MSIKAICSNSGNKPREIPKENWVVSGNEYTIHHIYKQMDPTQKGIQGCLLTEVSLEDLYKEGKTKHNCYRLDRFMFNIWLDYPTFKQELAIVKATTNDSKVSLNHILSAEEIVYFQNLVRRIPVADNVLEYAVKLSVKTRPSSEFATSIVKEYLSWGAGPRASQYLIIGAKCNALINGKFSPDIEDVKAVAKAVLRHRIVRNYKAEAEGYSVEKIIEEIL
jgi:hypothetical protein